MKTKVISVRVRLDTVVYCYQLQEQAGRTVRGKPVGTVISDTLEAVIEASRRMANIPQLDEFSADLIMEKFYDKAPPLFAVDFRELPKAEAKQIEPAGKQETRPNQASASAEPKPAYAPPVYVHVPTGDVYESPDVLPSQEVVLTHRGPGKTTAVQEGTCYMPEDNPSPTVPNPAVDVEKYIEQEAERELERDQKELEAVVNVGQVERTSPDVAPDVIPKCPWEGVRLEDVAVLEDDPVYKEALSIDELYAVAVRTVYAVLPNDMWGTDKAIALIKKTYKDYKSWKEKYGTEKPNKG